MHDYPTPEMIAANEAGYEAAMAHGAGRETNPHAEDSDAHRSWEAGWLQGRADLHDNSVTRSACGYHSI
jgi:hypothetical protein